jgi:hypothetical protein
MRTQDRAPGLAGAELKKSLRNLPDTVRAATEQSETFWQRQQAAIRSRIAVEEAAQLPWTGLVWIGALALVMTASLALLGGSRVSPASSQQASAHVQADPDQELLLAVEQSVYNGVPDALEPAAMLADDINSVAHSVTPARHLSKEKSNEN